MDAKGASSTVWHLLETGERWYRAAQDAMNANRISTSAIERWRLVDLDRLVARVDDPLAGRQVVLWEVPRDASGLAATLTGIARVADCGQRIVQIAYPGSGDWGCGDWYPVGLAIQEAGVSVLLADLWSLRTIASRLG